MTDENVYRCRGCGKQILVVVSGYSGYCYACVQWRKGDKR